MKNIESDIADRSFKRVYLLSGNETYLINQCRDRLKQAVLGETGNDNPMGGFGAMSGLGGDQSGSNMNFAQYDGNKGFDIKDLTESLMSFPFFADYRLVLAENSGLFGSAYADFADTVEQIPDTTVFVLIEEAPDKRTRLYKAIQKAGYVCEINTPDPANLARIVGKHFSELGKKISTGTLEYFIEYVGGDLLKLINEADKLSDYTGDRGSITEDDVRAICTMQIDNKIYEIIDNLINHNTARAMKIYFDLISLKESPLGILRLLMSQYNTLLLVREGMDERLPDDAIASSARLSSWVVRKNRAKLRDFTKRNILSSLVLCLNTEEDIKSGNIAESTGMEILLANLSSL